MFDLIIIGGGPAGVSAAVYAARKKLHTALIATEFGGQSIVSEKIYNWIGTPEISGTDLAKNLEAHVRYYEGDTLQVRLGQTVSKINKTEKGFSVLTEQGDSLETKTILIASGSGRRKLTVPGAEEFDGKGIVYCASCDGPLFSGQDVVVIGGGNAGFETAVQLTAYCKSVTLLHRSPDFKADKITVDKVLAKPNMTAMLNADISEVFGDKFVKGIKYIDKNTNEEKTLAVTGVFVEVGQIPNTGYAEGLVDFDEYKRIKINHKTCKSSLVGVWAAGDCADVLYHQNNIAAGDAVRAIEDIYVTLHAK